MSGQDYKRKKKVRQGRKRKRKWRNVRTILIYIVLILVLAVSGYYIIRTITQMHFSEVDIVLDAGHGGDDPGAVSGNVFEKEITLEIAKSTKELLEESGYKVGMTREEDCFVELAERARYGNKRNAKILISIHCNASDNPDGNGIETYYSKQKQLNDDVMADMIQKAVIGKTNASDRGIKAENYTVIIKSDMPAVLIEVGFLSNEIEKEMLQDEEYQKKLAEGIAQGVIEYLRIYTPSV